MYIDKHPVTQYWVIWFMKSFMLRAQFDTVGLLKKSVSNVIYTKQGYCIIKYCKIIFFYLFPSINHCADPPHPPGWELMWWTGFTWIHIYKLYPLILDTQTDHQLTAKQEKSFIFFMKEQTWPKCGFWTAFILSSWNKQSTHFSALKELFYFYLV